MSADPLVPDPDSDPLRSDPPRHPNASPHEGLGFDLPAPASLGAGRAAAAGLVAVGVLTAAFFAGYLPRRHARAVLEQHAHAADEALARVDVVSPHLGASTRSLLLPGSVHPLEQTVIYSRANGFLRRWLVDIGDTVREGQLLAEIETPEADQDILQARAQLAQAEAGVLLATANRDFSRADLERYRVLGPAGYASRQDLDQRQAAASVGAANLSVAQATVGAQRANLQRLLQLKSFSRVTAPFAGTITARTIDRGALVTAGSSTPLFTLAATDPARVFVQVPQDVAPSIRAGLPARVTVREYPGRVFEGLVSRSAGALDPASRTMNTEIRVPNPTGTLLAGMYAEVSLTLASPHRVFELPATAVMSDAGGLRAVVVTDDGRVHYVPVVIERDTGAIVQISSGLTGNERVMRIATAVIAEGTRVEVVTGTMGL